MNCNQRRGGTFFEIMSTSQKLAWPRWATWALLLVIVTSLLTIAATLDDIL